jgi:hypothetical protein
LEAFSLSMGMNLERIYFFRLCLLVWSLRILGISYLPGILINLGFPIWSCCLRSEQTWLTEGGTMG